MQWPALYPGSASEKENNHKDECIALTECLFKKQTKQKENHHLHTDCTGTCNLSSRTGRCWDFLTWFSAEFLYPAGLWPAVTTPAYAWSLLLIFFNYIKPSPNCLTCVQKTVLHDYFCISCFHWLFISIISMPNLVNSAAGSVWGGIWSEQILHSGCSSTTWNRPQGQSQQELPVGAFRAIPDLHLQTSCST